MDNNGKNMRKLMEEFKGVMNVLKESYVFDENDYDEQPMDYNEEEDVQGCEGGNAEDKINQIRSLSLEGLQEYSNNVDSEEYKFFKKVFLETDRICSEKKPSNHGEE